MVKKSSIIKKSKSEDVVRHFTLSKDTATLYPDFSFDAVEELIEYDPIAKGAINQYVSKCMEGDYNFIKKDKMTYAPEEEMLFNEKYMFRTKILRKIFLSAKFFNNVFVEIVRGTEGTVLDLNVLDSYNIEPITKPNGDPEKYVSKISNVSTGKKPEWKEKNVVWYKFNDRSVGYAPVDVKALWENLWIKKYIRNFVSWCWKTGQYRVLYNFNEETSDGDVDGAIAFIRQNDNNYQIPFIMRGLDDLKQTREMGEIAHITELLKYLDSQTLVLLRLPPIDAGIPDASGRSNSEAQSNNLVTSINDTKKIIEDYTNFELFKKMNKGNTLLRFAPADRFSEEMVYKNVQLMKSINMSDDAVTEYLQDRGIFFKTEKLFDDPMEQAGFAMGASNPRDKDNMPSRVTKSSGVANKQIGTGSQGTTKKEQLK